MLFLALFMPARRGATPSSGSTSSFRFGPLYPVESTSRASPQAAYAPNSSRFVVAIQHPDHARSGDHIWTCKTPPSVRKCCTLRSRLKAKRSPTCLSVTRKKSINL